MKVWRRLRRLPLRKAAAALALLVLVALLWTAPGPFPKAAGGAAEDPLRELYVERGHQLLLDGDWQRALVYLNAAYRGAENDQGLRFLLIRAASPLRRVPDGAVGYSADEGVPWRRQVELAGHRGPWQSADLSPGWKRLVAVAADGEAAIFDIADGRPKARLEHAPADLAAVRYSPDGERIAGLSTLGRVVVWHADTGKLDWGSIPEPLPRPPVSLAFSADAGKLITLTAAGVARILDPATGALLATFDTGLATAVALRPDGRQLVTAGERGAMIRNAASGRPIVSLDLPPRAAVHSLAYSPGGRFVVAASTLPEVRIFDAADGELAMILSGHRGLVRRAAFSAGGDLLLVAGDDGMARLWDARRGWQLGAWQLPASEVVHAEIEWPARRFATVHADGTLFIEPLLFDRTGPAEIDRLLACFVPWRLAAGRMLPATPGRMLPATPGQLVPATPDPRACRRIDGRDQPAPELATLPEPASTRLRPLPAVFDGQLGTSLRLHDADLVETLRSFARLLGLNLLIAPTVRGTVDADLTDVAVTQAWRELLRANDLRVGAIDSRLLSLIVPADWPVMATRAEVFYPRPPEGWPGELPSPPPPGLIAAISGFTISQFLAPVTAPPAAAPSDAAAAITRPVGASDVAKFEADPGGVAPDPGGWPGEPIDMSLRDADLLEVLRSFATIVDFEVIIDPDVSGSLTAELKNVPWDQALIDILRLHHLRIEIYDDRWRIRRREHEL